MRYLWSLDIPAQYNLRAGTFSSSLLCQICQLLCPTLISALEVATNGCWVIHILHSKILRLDQDVESVEEWRSRDAVHVAKSNGSLCEDDSYRLALAKLVASDIIN